MKSFCFRTMVAKTKVAPHKWFHQPPRQATSVRPVTKMTDCTQLRYQQTQKNMSRSRLTKMRLWLVCFSALTMNAYIVVVSSLAKRAFHALFLGHELDLLYPSATNSKHIVAPSIQKLSMHYTCASISSLLVDGSAFLKIPQADFRIRLEDTALNISNNGRRRMYSTTTSAASCTGWSR